MCEKRNFLFYCAMLTFTLLISGCAGSVRNMRVVPPDSIVTGPEEGKALLVFLRPSSIGYAIQSSVFEIKEEKPSLVGIVAAKKKVAYQVEPGKHLFMVVGESGDFMSAELEANRTYYALINPRMGVWKARFSFQEIHVDKLDSAQLSGWLSDCEWVEITPDSESWAANNIHDIQEKYYDYYSDWKSKGESSKPKLFAQDGKLSYFSKVKSFDVNDGSENYYSPQDAVDSFDRGEEGEYYSPQDAQKVSPSVDFIDNGKGEYYSPQD